MRARLFARFGPEAGLEVDFEHEATIGRGKGNTVLLSSREVSQQHARVYFDPDTGTYRVEDLGSLNGTLLDGQPLARSERLGGLHVLAFGAVAELFFVELDRDPGEAGAAEAEPEPAADGVGKTRIDAEAPTLPIGLRAPAAGGSTRVDSEAPTLPVGLRAQRPAAAADDPPGGTTRVEEGAVELPAALAGGETPAPRFALEVPGEAGGRFELLEGDNLVGRSGRARVVLRNRELSRRHATLRVEGGRVWLRDEGSRNHTFVGGEEIDGEVELEPGSELRFGRLEARLTVAGPGGGEEAE